MHEGAAGAGTDRNLQPLLLRGGAHRPGASRDPRAPEAARWEAGQEFLGRALRRHQPLRASPGPEWDAGDQVLPSHFEGGAEESAARAARQSREALEVRAGRPRGAGPVGRIHRGLRAGDRRDEHTMGALVCHPSGPQMAGTGSGLIDPHVHDYPAQTQDTGSLERRAAKIRHRETAAAGRGQVKLRCALWVVRSGCGGSSLANPSPSDLAKAAPDSFDVRFETTKGPFVMRAHRDWSPLGVDRLHYLTRNGFY